MRLWVVEARVQQIRGWSPWKPASGRTLKYAYVLRELAWAEAQRLREVSARRLLGYEYRVKPWVREEQLKARR